MGLDKTYIQYGVRSDWASDYAEKELSVTTFKNTTNKNLVEKYKIPGGQVKIVKDCLKRAPIEAALVEQLLHNSRYVCCLCRGTKGKAYIIHHIEEYSKSQDNSYGNLAVLCPNDHDLAHREGLMLTQKITPKEIQNGKLKWEVRVCELDVQVACRAGDINEIDFVNIPRIVSLYHQTFQVSPASMYESYLHEKGIINQSGELKPEFLANCSRDSFNLFMSGPNGGWQISHHYSEAFKHILSGVSFSDLDELLSVRKLKAGNLIGTPCFYVGGLYGKMPDLPLTSSTKPIELYFRKRKFWVSWLVDPNYMVSTTALTRLADHNVYQIYGAIRNINKREHKGQQYWHIDIRPYLFGNPTLRKFRGPFGVGGSQEPDDEDFEIWEP